VITIRRKSNVVPITIPRKYEKSLWIGLKFKFMPKIPKTIPANPLTTKVRVERPKGERICFKNVEKENRK
jgi:hypothetical protein